MGCGYGDPGHDPDIPYFAKRGPKRAFFPTREIFVIPKNGGIHGIQRLKFRICLKLALLALNVG